ncbi:MAG: hypothetical protein WC716_09760 [Chitinophagaceae bacterium]|jgi:hypothetical protein
MKKIILGLSVITTFLSACTKTTPRVNPPEPVPVQPGSKSYVNLKINGQTLVARDTILYNPGAAPYFLPMLCNYKFYGYDNVFDKTIAINSFTGDKYTNGTMKFVVAATGFARSHNKAVDTFKTVSTSADVYSVEEIKTKTIYKVNPESVIIITAKTDSTTRGVMTLYLQPEAGGGTITATGDFMIYQKNGF